MNILGWIIIGGIAGWLAAALVGSPRSGCLWNILIGILGAFLGGFIFTRITEKAFIYQFRFASLAVATLGAIALLLIINVVTRPRHRRR